MVSAEDMISSLEEPCALTGNNQDVAKAAEGEVLI